MSNFTTTGTTQTGQIGRGVGVMGGGGSYQYNNDHEYVITQTDTGRQIMLKTLHRRLYGESELNAPSEPQAGRIV